MGLRELSRLDFRVRLAEAFGIRLAIGVVGLFRFVAELGVWFAGAFVDRVWFTRIDHLSFLSTILDGTAWDGRIVAQSSGN